MVKRHHEEERKQNGNGEVRTMVERIDTSFVTTATRSFGQCWKVRVVDHFLREIDTVSHIAVVYFS